MQQAFETRNRRKFPRFNVGKDIFILAKTHNSLAMGDLKDISLGGAAFESVPIDHSTDDLRLDIVYLKKGLNLNNIKTKIVNDTVTDFKLAEKDNTFLETRKYSVQFLDMGMDQKFHLDCFLSEHVLETFDLRQYK